MGALVESEPLDAGPPVGGSRFRDVFEDLGRRVELEAEVVEFEPPRLLAVHLVSDVFEATSTSRLEALAGGTRLAAAIETTYTSLAARLLAPAVTRHAQKQLEADLDRLKGLVEAERGRAGSPLV
jgi:hypothetical protein